MTKALLQVVGIFAYLAGFLGGCIAFSLTGLSAGQKVGLGLSFFVVFFFGIGLLVRPVAIEKRAAYFFACLVAPLGFFGAFWALDFVDQTDTAVPFFGKILLASFASFALSITVIFTKGMGRQGRR
jgi:hypothetical protein